LSSMNSGSQKMDGVGVKIVEKGTTSVPPSDPR